MGISVNAGIWCGTLKLDMPVGGIEGRVNRLRNGDSSGPAVAIFGYCYWSMEPRSWNSKDPTLLDKVIMIDIVVIVLTFRVRKLNFYINVFVNLVRRTVGKAYRYS